MRLISIFVIGLIFIVSCDNQTVHESTVPNDNVKTVPSEDQLMNSAIENAKLTFTQFDTAFKNGHFDTSQFSLKIRFETAIGGEHIWTYGITFQNNSYYGIIDEDPVAAKNIRKGDKVKITKDNLSDWMYSDNGTLRGGFTIRALRDKMSPEERKTFDSTFYLRIID
jgi:uncharacterized protein YegJ (DUF2314 family)